MSDPVSLSEQERADLVAYLDGELGGEAARALEAKLSLNPEARAEADALRRAWDLLDFLPRPEPSPNFTQRTVSRVAPLPAARGRPWLVGLGWAAAVLLTAAVGYSGFNVLAPRGPTEEDLVRELRLIENKRLYDLADDLDFLRALDDPELFGEDGAGS